MTHHNNRITSYEKWGLFCLSVLIVYVSWWKSGRGLNDRWGLLAVSIFTFIVLPIGVWWGVWKRKDKIVVWKSILKDPFFYVSLVFLVYVGIQTWNSPRELVFDRDLWEWIYGPPPHPELPSSINTAESQQFLIWFFAAWVPILYLRTKLFTSRAQLRLLQIMVINAGALAIFGFIQYATGTTKQYWFHPLPGYFFSSFGYPNHAGEFFYFNSCLCAGLFFNGIRINHNSRVKLSRKCGLYGALFCLCIGGSIFSGSVAAILISGFIVVCCLMYAAKKYVKYLSVGQKMNGAIAAIWLMLIGGFVVVQFGDYQGVLNEVKRSFGKESTWSITHPNPSSTLGRRYPTWVPAVKMIPDYWQYGTGSWGFRYLKKLYQPRSEWKTSVGYANVHNDFIQFVVEYGAVGCVFLFGGGLIILVGFLRSGTMSQARFVFTLGGLFLIVVHSMVDLPFRCPAILVYLGCVLSCTEVFAKQGKVG